MLDRDKYLSEQEARRLMEYSEANGIIIKNQGLNNACAAYRYSCTNCYLYLSNF